MVLRCANASQPQARFQTQGTRGCGRELFPAKEGFLFLDGTNTIGGHKMLRTLMISAAVSALMVSGALAQADMSKQPAAKTDAAPHDTTKFIPAQGTDEGFSTKFKGTDALAPNNATSGNVNDMLSKKNGKILGRVVGVGGFLGMGKKSVAIDMSASHPVPADTGSST